MLSDEIDAVRIRAINALQRIGSHYPVWTADGGQGSRCVLTLGHGGRRTAGAAACEQNLTLKLDQIKIVLGAVDDAQSEIRRSVHRLFRCVVGSRPATAREHGTIRPNSPLCAQTKPARAWGDGGGDWLRSAGSVSRALPAFAL